MDSETSLDSQGALQFESLLESHRGILFKVANTYCWQAEDRADLMQEMATQLWRAWPGFDSKRLFSTWMYRIALNVAINYVREHSARQRHIASIHDGYVEPLVSDTDDIDVKRKLLHDFIQRQRPLDRALLLLYLEARTQREIAEILGLTESNVSTKVGRLKQRLRDEI